MYKSLRRHLSAWSSLFTVNKHSANLALSLLLCPSRSGEWTGPSFQEQRAEATVLPSIHSWRFRGPSLVMQRLPQEPLYFCLIRPQGIWCKDGQTGKGSKWKKRWRQGADVPTKSWGTCWRQQRKGLSRGYPSHVYLWGFHVVRHQGQRHPSAWIGVAHFQILRKQRNPCESLAATSWIVTHA